MSKVQLTLPYSDSASLTLALDESILGEVISPQRVKPVGDEGAAIRAALDAPIGAQRLEDAVKPGSRVLILSDDNTRPTPVARILPHLLERLQRAGVEEGKVEILIASGTHRPMTPEEIRAKVGTEVARRIPVSCHRCGERGDLFRAGTTPDGVEVWLNRKLLEADFILGIGNVVPHPQPGWSGGAKILYPGVAGAETIATFHLVGAEDPTNYLGREDAPARRSLETLAETAGLNFIVDTVLTADHRLYGVYCGNPRQAQAAAQRASRAVYGVPVEHPYRVVLSNSYPAFLEFWQAGKGIFSADLILEPGGTIVLTTPCPEGVGVTHPKQVEYLGLDVGELLRRIAARKVDDPIAAAVCAKVKQVMQRARVFVVSEGLARDDLRAMGFTPFESVEEALGSALKEHGQDTRVAAITHGGETVPYLV